MSVKVTKKQLKEISERLDAYYLGGNVYDYESDVFAIQCDNDRFKLGKNESKNELISRLKDYERKGKNYSISCKQVVYSAGAYGNTGQLHQVMATNKNGDVKDLFFIYYC